MESIDSHTPIKDMDFPRSFNHNVWQQYLQRPLLPLERNILENARAEKHFNEILENIHNIGLKKGLYVSHLTNLYGNCLFESLIELGIGTSVKTLREAIACIIYIYRDYKSFFETQEETIQELFVFSNEIEYVYCQKENTFYKYTYDVMCQDMSNENSWTRLPTQLFLMVISQIYQKEIVIIHDSGYETIINTNKNPSNKIYLGLMGESHYIPLKELTNDTNMVSPKYNEAKIAFFVWATQVWKQLNETVQQTIDDTSQINTDDFIPINNETDENNNELYVSFN